MPDISKRIASLSPERRKLLHQLLRHQNRALQSPDSFDPQLIRGISSPARLNFSGKEVKSATREFYKAINEQLSSSIFGEYSMFLNYGYVSDTEPEYAVVILPPHMLNRNSIKLVLETIGDFMVTDRRILDVGCGRGGTIYVLDKYFSASSLIGIDLCPEAIAFCQAQYHYIPATFLEGDAEMMPFADAYFQVVINIESSHSYPNLFDFYREVYRVLEPDGYFLYTDIFPSNSMEAHMSFLQELGFVCEQDRDITANVLLSCDEIANQRLQAFKNNDITIMRDFIGARGSRFYIEMETGLSTYRIFRFQKHPKRQLDDG
jgi:SAM-dependent methyltransferase